MPWEVGDVESHIKGLTDKQKRVWVGVANDALARCLKDGGETKTCEGSAIRQANSVAKKVEESGMDLTEVGRMLSTETIKAIDDAMSAIQGGMVSLKALIGKGATPIISATEAAKDLNVGGGIDREKIPAEDFAGKNRSFPIVTPGDVSDAASSIGRAGPDNYSTDELKARIIAIAKRKGASFVAELPKAWQALTKESTDLEITGETIMLIEKAIRADGTVPIKLIAPGWGSSGHYSKEVLQRDGPAAFPAKTKMFWNHQTAEEEAARPEGDLNNLAAEFVNGATYQEEGKAGPGLYADAKVFTLYKAAVEELAPHIGTSIRARGMATQGEVEGRKGPIIEKINQGISVDFVTQAGAGGQIVQLFEAARPAPIHNQTHEEVHQLDEKEAQVLREAKEAVDKANEILTAEVVRFREAAILREARDIAAVEIGKSPLPDVTKARLIETVLRNATVKDGVLDKAEYAQVIEAAVNAEREYIATLTSQGVIKGMGSNGGGGDDGHKALAESFKILYRAQGKTTEEAEKLATMAAEGR